MFGWRKKQIAKEVDADINDTAFPEPTVTPPIPKVNTLDNKEAAYTIGLNEVGNTQLRVKLDYGSATLTMTPAGVHALIRQLLATLPEVENND